MSGLPAGTVTFLFTDIEGSTRLLQNLGVRYADLIADHHRLLRAVFGERGGTEVQDHGDGFYYTFPSAKAAVQAAVAAQQAIAGHAWPEGASVRVRMGLHTGEPIGGETGYVGLDIHRAARICAAGHGGQILLSLTTRDLVADELPDGLRLRDLGEHRLKDLTNTQHLFQMIAPDLREDFPALKSLNVLPNNLPHQLTSFVGRERESAEVKRLLETSRLLTFTGIGGCGKTRLAIHVGADLLGQFPEGVWLVELAALSDPQLVPHVVATALGVIEQPKRPLMTTLTEALKPRHLLLILDNCEHLLTVCAHLADTLLKACPHISMLATSREALGILGETAYHVPSLSLPDLPVLPVEHLMEHEAVRLFVDRAAAASPGFALTAQSAPAVATVCRRLDGIPLAIELAAPRIKAMTIEQLSERLSDRFRLLTGGSRTALPRQQTLQATMDWSYALLTGEERAMFRRLSVFAGRFTLEAAEAACAGRGVEAAEVLDILTHLVEKSLVVFDERAGRYRLLETVRQYGRDRLLEAGEADEARTRHRDFFLALVERAVFRGPEAIRWTRDLEADHDNLRTALEWSLERGEAEAAQRLAARLSSPFWLYRTYFTEGLGWVERALAAPGEVPDGVRAGALAASALMAINIGELELATRRNEESIALGRQTGEQRTVYWALHTQGWVETVQGRTERAAALFNEALTLAREIGDTYATSAALTFLASVVMREDFKRAVALLEESLALQRQLNDPWGLNHVLVRLGGAAQIAGDYDRAETLFREALGHLQALGSTGVGTHQANLAALAAVRGDYAGARALLDESLRLHRNAGDSFFVIGSLNELGWVALCEGDVEQASQVFDESLALARRSGSKSGIASTLQYQGVAALVRGDLERAEPLLQESLTFYRESRTPFSSAQCLRSLATLARQKGDLSGAEAMFHEGLRLMWPYENRLGIARSFEGLAGVAVARNQPERAARLLGASEAIRTAIRAPLASFEQPGYKRDVAAARVALGDQAFTAARDEARTMTLEQAVEYALAGDS